MSAAASATSAAVTATSLPVCRAGPSFSVSAHTYACASAPPTAATAAANNDDNEGEKEEEEEEGLPIYVYFYSV